MLYQVPCVDSNCMYIGETGRTLEKRLSEHRGAVKRNDSKNRIIECQSSSCEFCSRTSMTIGIHVICKDYNYLYFKMSSESVFT